MRTKHLLTISLLLPLVAISATAQAGSTITDKSYWPSEARQSVSNAASYGGAYSAFAYDRRGSSPAATVAGAPTSRYQGGPKGR